MTGTAFRIFLNGAPATAEQLDRVDEITVAQGTGVAWVARVRFAVERDAAGVWSGEDHPFTVPFTRVRIEVRPAAGEGFRALIEGPVVGSEARLSALPGQSAITAEVHDESVMMNRRERVEVYQGQTADQLARRLFAAAGLPRSEVDPAPPPSGGFPPVYVQRETDLQFLRRLARDLGMHAYVLPGRVPGACTGAFKALPVAPSGLPELLLLGPDRNLGELRVRALALRPAAAGAASLSAANGQATSARSTLGAVPLLGKEPPVRAGDAAFVLLAPGRDGAVDARRWTAAATGRSADACEAAGRVGREHYPAVLAPYQVVSVRAIDGRNSGDWRVHAVTHTLTRLDYTQDFTLRRNARSAGTRRAGGVSAVF